MTTTNDELEIRALRNEIEELKRLVAIALNLKNAGGEANPVAEAIARRKKRKAVLKNIH